MKSTANYALPYPESSDHTRTWEYWQGLADAVDAALYAGKVNKPYAFAGHLAAKITGPSNNVQVVMDQVSVNKGPFTNSAAGLTIPINGVYGLRFRALVAAGTAQHCQIWIKNAAGTGLAYGANWVVGGANHVIEAAAPVIALAAGDVIKCWVWYGGDVFPSEASGAVATELTAILIGAT